MLFLYKLNKTLKLISFAEQRHLNMKNLTFQFKNGIHLNHFPWEQSIGSHSTIHTVNGNTTVLQLCEKKYYKKETNESCFFFFFRYLNLYHKHLSGRSFIETDTRAARGARPRTVRNCLLLVRHRLCKEHFWLYIL